jgi:hypothetical protein
VLCVRAACTHGCNPALTRCTLRALQAGLAKQADLLAARAKARAPKTGTDALLDMEMLTAKERRIKARGGA